MRCSPTHITRAREDVGEVREEVAAVLSGVPRGVVPHEVVHDAMAPHGAQQRARRLEVQRRVVLVVRVDFVVRLVRR